MFESLPAPTSTTVKSGKYGPFQQTKREATTRFEIGETPSGLAVVEVITSHDPDSKVFRAYCTWGRVSSEGGFSVFSWSSDHAYKALLRDPVARYSKKALEEAHGRVLAAIEASFEVVSHVFNEAAAAASVPEEV